MFRKKILLLVFASTFLLVGQAFTAFAPTQQEYLLKAAFVYRFTDYVEWDDTYSQNETFNIAILGESDILQPLLEVSKTKKAQNKRIAVKQFNNINDAGACQVVFISRNYRWPVEYVISKLQYRPVLIITEQRADFDKGAHVNFVIADNNLRFDINLKAVNVSGLKMSSQLLQHALTIRR